MLCNNLIKVLLFKRLQNLYLTNRFFFSFILRISYSFDVLTYVLCVSIPHFYPSCFNFFFYFINLLNYIQIEKRINSKNFLNEKCIFKFFFFLIFSINRYYFFLVPNYSTISLLLLTFSFFPLILHSGPPF
jgi:hypothetical protein